MQTNSFSYCRANQEWQWRNILFTIAKSNINLYTPLELARIDRSLVYKSYPQDMINTQVIYRLQIPDNFVNKTCRHYHSWLTGQ